MKRLVLAICVVMLNISNVSAVELTKPSADPSVPYTKIEIKPTFDLFMGAGSITKGTSLKAGDFKDDIKCYFLISRILLNKLEMGIELESKPHHPGYCHAFGHVFWKTPKFEVQLFAPKSVSNEMFLDACTEDKGMEFAEIEETNQIYSTSHQFLSDGICNEGDKNFISKKVSMYLRSGDENNKFEFGFSFTPASHSSLPSVEKEKSIEKSDFLKSVKDSFVGSDIVSCAQSYEHKTKKGVSLKICTIQEFGSVKSLDLKTIKNNGDGTYDFEQCTYTSPREAYALGLSGELGINDTKLKAAISRSSVQEALKNFCMSCAIEQNFDEGYKVELSYFQSYDKQNQTLIGTNESMYRSVVLRLEKELSKEVCLYIGVSGYRGYKDMCKPCEDKGLGLSFGTKIEL
jgi:hypothetical protein